MTEGKEIIKETGRVEEAIGPRKKETGHRVHETRRLRLLSTGDRSPSLGDRIQGDNNISMETNRIEETKVKRQRDRSSNTEDKETAWLPSTILREKGTRY